MKNKKTQEEKIKTATTLHWLFDYLSGNRTSTLAENSNINNKEFLRMFEEFLSTCDIYQRYKHE